MIKRGVIAIIFDIKNEIPYFLILHRSFVWNGWEFAKGGMSNKDIAEQAVIKKVYDSTKLKKISIIKKLENKRQFLHRGAFYSYDIFLIRADMTEEADISDEVTEHDRFAWLPYTAVLDRLYWDAEKRDVISFMAEFKNKMV